jgi:hypothetical protein
MPEAALRKSDEGTAQTPPAPVDVRASLGAVLDDKLTPRLVDALQDPRNLDVARFEVRQALEKVTKWFVK